MAQKRREMGEPNHWRESHTQGRTITLLSACGLDKSGLTSTTAVKDRSEVQETLLHSYMQSQHLKAPDV